MHRRDFLTISGTQPWRAADAVLLRQRRSPPKQLLSTLDLSVKKSLADAALDRRQGRRGHLLRRAHRPLPAPVRDHPRKQGAERRQYRIHRRRRPRHRQRHLGLRRHQRPEHRRRRQGRAPGRGHRQGQRQAARPSRSSSRPAKGVGEVSWKTPIQKNAMEVPIKEKVDLLLDVNAAAIKAGANFVNSHAVPGQRAEVFRQRPTAPTSIRTCTASGRPSRSPPSTRPPASSAPATACPRRWAWAMNTWTARRRASRSPNGVVAYGDSYDMKEDAVAAAKQAQAEAEGAVGQARQVRSGARPLAHSG